LLGWVANKLFGLVSFVSATPIVLLALVLYGLHRYLGALGDYLMLTILFVLTALFPKYVMAIVWIVAAVALLTVVASGLVWLSGLGFGRTGLFLSYSAETTPPGVWTLHQFLPDVTESNGGAGDSKSDGRSSFFAHSSGYNHPAALETLVTWLRALFQRTTQ